jgi:hypothetical protein
MPHTAAKTALQPLHRLFPLAWPLLAVAALAGCGNNGDKFAPACPQLQLLPDAADLNRSRGTGTDLTDMILQGHITAVPASCADGGAGKVNAKIQVMMDAVRGPAATASTMELPYLVSIMSGEQIIQQKQYTAVAAFPPNVDRVRVAGEDIDMIFPVSADKPASNYRIYVSFRLTAAELAYNRRQKP